MRDKDDLVNHIDPDDNGQLFDLLHEVMHNMRAALLAAVADDESNLALMEARALAFLAHHPDATAGDLAKRSGRDKGQVARLIATLAERGLIVRAQRSDRRSHTLHLTSQGKAVQRRLERKRARAASAMFAPLTREERASFARLLRRLLSDPAR